MRDKVRNNSRKREEMCQAQHVEVGLVDGIDHLDHPLRHERLEEMNMRSPNAGLVVTVGGTAVRRDVIVAAAVKYRLPAIYPYRYFAVDGGLISYGPDTVEPYVRAASYVDGIFRGADSDEVARV